MAIDKKHIYKLLEIIDRYQNYFRGSNSRVTKKHYGYIPASAHTTVDTLIRVNDYIMSKKGDDSFRSVKFLDIGCGIGNVMLIAQYMSWVASGIDRRKRSLATGKKLLGGVGEFIYGDILKFRRYRHYDVLYYYQPMHGDGLMQKLVDKLAKDMKEGAIVIVNGADDFKFEKNFYKISDNDWQLLVYQKEA